MKYSFVIIAFNEEHNISNCIRSILSQNKLGNSYEVLVIDDGSTDSTPKIVLDISRHANQVTLIGDGINRGRGHCRNIGVLRSKGDYVIMIDADILLPHNWLEICIKNLKKGDVIGGIAIPDGDVAYVYRRFKLQPKTVNGSTIITGNNGLYKRQVFKTINFDPRLREGEDVDFNHQSNKAGYISYRVPDLIVEHQENKSYTQSLHWLFQSGVGATRQLLRFREIRLPDIAFVITIILFIFAILLAILSSSYAGFLLPCAALVGASLAHLRGKFYLRLSNFHGVFCALVSDMLLIFSYYLGRLLGFAVYFLGSRRSRNR